MNSLPDNTLGESFVNSTQAPSRHDLLATLAVLKGFGQALNTSFDQLGEHIALLVDSDNPIDQTTAPANIKALNAECLMFIKRIQASTEKLTSQLQDEEQ